ncbi:hypothetical protein DFJ73DRAFT_856285 [Zopfochytrium polystomum]|nr:hypothetical protein DFJ73DRAFT_856285 [Zopfochytrium polystomum]
MPATLTARCRFPRHRPPHRPRMVTAPRPRYYYCRDVSPSSPPSPPPTPNLNRGDVLGKVLQPQELSACGRNPPLPPLGDCAGLIVKRMPRGQAVSDLNALGGKGSVLQRNERISEGVTGTAAQSESAVRLVEMIQGRRVDELPFRKVQRVLHHPKSFVVVDDGVVTKRMAWTEN